MVMLMLALAATLLVLLPAALWITSITDGRAGLRALFARVFRCGFLAPVLAKQSPAVLDSINQYSPVVIINGLAAILFMIGYVLFGVAMIRTATLPRWSGVLVAVGAPAHLLGFGIAQLVSTAAWPIAILGSVCLGAGLGWAGYRLRRTPTASDVVASDRTTAV